ncbi:MAG: hypothetical protein ACOCZ5_00315 [bacterium]
MAYNTKLKLIDAKMEQSSGSTLTLSGNTIYDVSSDGMARYTQHPDFTGSTSIYNDPQVLVDKEYVDNKVGGETEVFRFTEDIVVSIEEGKTFGRYENKDVIPASGKTPNEVILLALQEPINPTVSVTYDSTGSDVSYGLSSKEINLNLSYTINSAGATSDSAVLEWRRGTSGSWTQLTTLTTGVTGFTGTYEHIIDDSGDRFESDPAEYRLLVEDTQQASNEDNITFDDDDGTNGGFRKIMEQDAGPSITSFTVEADEINYAPSETNSNRERGNSISEISATINSGRDLKELVEVRLQRRIGTGSWTTIETYNTFTDNNTELIVTDYLDDAVPNSTANSISYRFQVDDQVDTNRLEGTTRTVNFQLPYFYGSSTTQPTANQALIDGGSGVVASSNGDITINFGSSGTEFMWFATPATSTTKVWWEENNNNINTGPIGTDQLFEPPSTVSVDSPNAFWSGVDYKIYIGGYDGNLREYNLLNTQP